MKKSVYFLFGIMGIFAIFSCAIAAPNLTRSQRKTWSNVDINLDVLLSPHYRHHHYRAYYKWVPNFRHRMPHGAVVGGHERGKTFFICQAYFRDGVHPGKTVNGRCNIGYAGKEVSIPMYRVLVGRGFHWRHTSYGRIPRDAVVGGYEHGHSLYVCRARYRYGTHPGKVVGRNCNFGYGGREIRKHYYQVLVR